MSYGEAYSTLYVICKNEQQQRELMTLLSTRNRWIRFIAWNDGMPET